ncbi:MAG: hypothetical protein HYY05_06225, partial [Chloroflexi bacterium]|nr:hypothetical protein [Chloroflexota bacterium]
MPYLLAPLLLLSREPLIVTALLALLNVASIPFCYRLVARYFGRREALLASLLYAGSFWAAYIARQAWDMAPMAPLALLVLDRLLAATAGRRPAALGWAFFWAALAVAVHPAALGLAGAVVVVALALRPRLSWTTLPGLASAAVAWAPFLWYLGTSQWRDLRQALQVGVSPPEIDLDIAGLALWQLFPHPRDDLFQSPGGSVLPAVPLLEVLHWIVVGLSLAALASGVARGLPALRRPAGPGAPYLVLVLAWMTPIALLVRHSFPLFNHYAFPLLPYSAIILAVGLTAAARTLPQFQVSGFRFRVLGTPNPERATRNRGRKGALGLALALAAVQVWALVTLLHWVGDNGGTFWRGSALRFMRQALDVAAASRASPEDPVYIAIGEHHQHWGYLVQDRFPISIVNHHTTLAFPAAGRPVVYLTAVDESLTARLLRQRFPDAERFHLKRSSLPDYYRVFSLPPDAGVPAQATVIQTEGPWALDNGIRLEGYALQEEIQPARELPLTLAWTVVAAPPPEPRPDFRFFAHLLDRAGRKWGEANALDYGTSRWQPGDRIITWLAVPVPADAPRGLYGLSFGMFDTGSLDRVTIGDGAARRDALMAEPIRVLPVRPPAPPVHALEPPARFGGALDLLGYDLPISVAGGGVLDLRLLWRAAQPVATDYTLFVHVLDAGGQLLVQEDGFPAGGLYPTSAWRPGEVVEDRRRVALPPAVAGQKLRIALGWYRLDTGRRLTLEGSTESNLTLGPVQALP